MHKYKCMNINMQRNDDIKCDDRCKRKRLLFQKM
jgi:hypothetical protein